MICSHNERITINNNAVIVGELQEPYFHSVHCGCWREETYIHKTIFYHKRFGCAMKKLVVLSIILLIGGLALIGIGLLPDTPAPELEFPISNPDLVARLAAYHTPNWGEPGVFHNGIDLVISTNVKIVSPCNGSVSGIEESVNPYAGNILFKIKIAIDRIWEVDLVLEPGFRDDTNNSLQSDSIHVNAGDVLSTGDTVADLLFSENYAHLHFMLLYRGMDVSPYDFSSSAAKATFEEIASRSNSTIQYSYEMPQFYETMQFKLTVGIGLSLTIIALVLFKFSK